MKISRLACRQFLPAAATTAAAAEDGDTLAALLTARGLEVDSVTPAAVAGGIIAGEIVACRPHPEAARLTICRVDIKTEMLDIVCGAPNARKGLRVAVAPPGAVLSARGEGGKMTKLTISARKIRGVMSAGMLCSAAELGIGAAHDGIVELAADEGEIGAPLDDTLLLNDDILNVNITPNRGDCLSHLGIAREIAAATGQMVTPAQAVTPLNPAAPCAWPPRNLGAAAADTEEAWPVQIDDNARAACPYYACAIIRNADCGGNLRWQWRTLIERCGGRAVSAAVDITNYLMLLYGQPLHAFDLDKLQGGIRVRYAAAGEKLTVLDGSEIVCADSTLLIADSARALALAGVMGGADSGISAGTKNILLEAAHFTPASVAGRARDFKLNSEAAYRFERGVDPSLPPFALTQAAACLKKSCGEKVTAGKLVAAAGAPPPPPAALTLAAEKIQRVLGVDIAAPQAAALLNTIAVPTTLTEEEETATAANAAATAAAAGRQTLRVAPPSWRFDLTIGEDILEEICRLYGYDKLPETLPPQTLLTRPPRKTLAQRAREFFAARGFYEAVNYAFVPPRWEETLGAAAAKRARLVNPLSEEMSVMRTTLWGGLLHTALYNVRRQQEQLCLFEIGRCFLPRDDAPAGAATDTAKDEERLPHQPLKLAGLMYGLRNADAQRVWDSERAPHNREVDFYDIKGALEGFLQSCALPPAGAAGELAAQAIEFSPLAAAPGDNSGGGEGLALPVAALNPRQAALVLAGGKAIGLLGELDAANAAALIEDFPSPPLLFELDLDALAALKDTPGGGRAVRPLQRAPLVRRDLSLETDQPAGQLLARARQIAPAPPVLDVHLFDVYKERNTCGLRFVLQGQDEHLTGEAINKIMEDIRAALQKT